METEVEMQVVEKGKGRKHFVCFGAEGARVGVVGTATSGNEDGVGSCNEGAKETTLGAGATVGSKKQ
jgi:hypothetical protein